MTLFKQIIIILSILLTMIFAAVMWFNFNSSKEYVKQQAYTDALHTANSLGLAISTVASVDDVSMADTMISAVFDSGYYEKIVLTDMKHKVLVTKNQKVIVAGVPNWFINHVNLVPPVASSQIMLGWTPYGVLSVQINSGHAYRQLWNIFKEVFAVFIVISIIGFFILQIVLSLILKPLKKVTEQANAILENDFIFQHNIPFTIELKNVVFAMNSMVKKVKEIFEKEINAVRSYHELLYQDASTKMFNRRYFNIKLEEYLYSEETNAQGALILISLNDFNSIKNKIGYQKSETFIKMIAELINEAINQNHEYVSAKLNDTDFAILAPTTADESFIVLCEEISVLVQKVIKSFGLNEKEHFINIGYAKYYCNSNAKELFSSADFALSESKSKGAYSISVFDNEKKDIHVILGKEAWTKEIQSAMEEKRFKLACQDVVDIENFSNIFHSELFLRLQDSSNHLYNAGYFMPMVMELKLGSKMDRYVILHMIRMTSEKTFICKAICINLGKEIFLQSNNYSMLEDSIINFKQTSNRMLYFEIKISNIPSEILIKFSKYLRGLGYGLGLDNFTLNSENLVLMQQINPAYIKIHASYLLDLIAEDSFNAPSRSLGIITDSMEIKVIASHVENMEQKEKLQELGIKYIQGSLVEEPKLLE